MSDKIIEGLRGPEYIGDGVYVGRDGSSLILRTSRDGGGINEIFLEPDVFDALEKYVKRVMKSGARS